jgi:hypothetical protein
MPKTERATEVKIERLKKLWADTSIESMTIIAERLGMTQTWVRTKATALGLPDRPKQANMTASKQLSVQRLKREAVRSSDQ